MAANSFGTGRSDRSRADPQLWPDRSGAGGARRHARGYPWGQAGDHRAFHIRPVYEAELGTYLKIQRILRR